MWWENSRDWKRNSLKRTQVSGMMSIAQIMKEDKILYVLTVTNGMSGMKKEDDKREREPSFEGKQT